MSQGGKVEKSGGLPSPQVQTEIDPSAHSGAERPFATVVNVARRSKGVNNIVFTFCREQFHLVSKLTYILDRTFLPIPLSCRILRLLTCWVQEEMRDKQTLA